MVKLITSEPPIELTEKEKDKLEMMRKEMVKGYVGDYNIKYLHVCPKCRQAKGWRNFVECLNCGYKIGSKEYQNLDRLENWEELGPP